MKKNVLLFILLLFVISVNGQVIPGNYDKNLKYAQTYIISEEYSGALPYLLEAWKVKNTDPKVAYDIMTCYVNTNQEIKVLPFLQKAKEGGIKDAKYDFYAGRAYHLQHKFETAIKYYESYKATLKPNNPDLYEVTQDIACCKNGMELIKNPVKVKITNLGPVVNSQYPEYAPVISADESVLIITSRRPNTTGGKIETSTGQYYEDIYQSNKLKDSSWSAPVEIGNGINTSSHDACIALSPDGMELIIYKATGHDNGDLYVSELKGNVWGTPKRYGSSINTNNWEPSASITSDEKTIFFTSNRDGGMGGTDIYMTRKLANGEFGPAIHLGPKINTEEDEDAPFIHADGKTLYFSSKGHKSMGGYDIFYCTINAETGEILSEPKNIGYPINTADDDIFFVWSADNKRAYFSSIREGGYGDKDIYMLEREEAKAALVVLKGLIVSCDGGTPVAATIIVTDLTTQKPVGIYNSNSKTGKYTVVLPAGKNYGISVESPGYLFQSKNIDIPLLDKYLEIIDTICMSQMKVGTSIVLRNVFFDVNKSTLRPESVQELDRLADILKDNPALKIEISGHTDSDGNDDANMKLSNDRAKAVVDYLVAKGINAGRLTWKGYGETMPMAPNDTPENKQQNRRTEFKVLSN